MHDRFVVTASSGGNTSEPELRGRLGCRDATQRVELIHIAHGHTKGDAVAWLPKHGILFAGDSCLNGPFNYTGDSDTASWIGALTDVHEHRAGPRRRSDDTDPPCLRTDAPCSSPDR